ncbi:MAG: protein YgfX [Gammaproteobacteria bacterium]
MSQNQNGKFTTNLRVEVKSSASYRILLIACYSLSGIICLTLSLNLIVKLTLCLGSIVYGLYLTFYRHGSNNKSRISQIEYSDQQGWRLIFANNNQVNTELRLPVFVTTFLVIARFGSGLTPRYTLVIPFDAVDSHSFRQLRVRLLQSAHGH